MPWCLYWFRRAPGPTGPDDRSPRSQWTWASCVHVSRGWHSVRTAVPLVPPQASHPRVPLGSSDLCSARRVYSEDSSYNLLTSPDLLCNSIFDSGVVRPSGGGALNPSPVQSGGSLGVGRRAPGALRRLGSRFEWALSLEWPPVPPTMALLWDQDRLLVEDRLGEWDRDQVIEEGSVLAWVPRLREFLVSVGS